MSTMDSLGNREPSHSLKKKEQNWEAYGENLAHFMRFANILSQPGFTEEVPNAYYKADYLKHGRQR